MQRNLSLTVFFALFILFIAQVTHAAIIPSPILERDVDSDDLIERDTLPTRAAAAVPHEAAPTTNPEAPKPPLPLTTVDGAVVPVRATTIATAIPAASTTIDPVAPVAAITSDFATLAPPFPTTTPGSV